MPNSLSPRDRTTLVVWFIAALVVRGVVIWTMAGNLEADTDGYRLLAENLRNEGVYGLVAGEPQPTAFRPPLYPLLLTLTVNAGRVSLALVAVLHVALGTLTVAAVWSVARRVGLKWGAHAAALAVAVDPILLMQSTQVMTETLAAFFVAAVVWALVEAFDRNLTIGWLGSGLLLGAASLCRPTFLVSAAFIVAAVSVSVWRNSRPSRPDDRQPRQPRTKATIFAPVLLLLVGFAPLPIAWTWRNYQTLGHPIFATTHGGYTLLLGNNPEFYDHLRSGKSVAWRSNSLDARVRRLQRKNGWSELEYDRWAGHEAKQNIRNDIGGFARASLHRVLRLWGVLPRQTMAEESTKRRLSRYAVAIWYSLLFSVALIGLLLRRLQLPRSASIGVIAFIASFTLLHLVYWCDMRMRGPLTPVIALVAGAALPRKDASDTPTT